MSSLLRRFFLLAGSVCVALTSLQPFAVAQHPTVETKADVDRLVQELSNWGRWGNEDQLGTLNLITAEKRRDAMKLVREGVVVSLARQMETDQAADNGLPFVHTMISSGHDADGQWAMGKARPC